LGLPGAAKAQTRPEPRETEGIATDSRDREQE
jgi:hypothetical protein